jgi:hypothetical protein
MRKLLFTWCSVDKPTQDHVTRELANLWAACKHGKEVDVNSSYGKPPAGTRGMFYHTCGCGFDFDHIQDRGYAIGDTDGNEYLVDAMALHVVACHWNKLDAEEVKLLHALPTQTEWTDREGLEEILRMELPRE